MRKAEVVEQIRDRLAFVDYAPVCFTSAARGDGVPELFDAVQTVAAETQHRVTAAEVSEVLRRALERRPISVAGVPLTLQAAAQVSTAPPTFALRVNKPDEIHFSYQRYLVNALREAFGFSGSPIRLSLRRAVGRRARSRSARR